jgi:hypothetical protein
MLEPLISKNSSVEIGKRSNHHHHLILVKKKEEEEEEEEEGHQSQIGGGRSGHLQREKKNFRREKAADAQIILQRERGEREREREHGKRENVVSTHKTGLLMAG